jgi:thymidine phosphorylase
MMYLPQEIIRKKRNGQSLSAAEIEHFVKGVVNKDYNDAQLGAMAMAIFQQGMSTDETVCFTQRMMHSGNVLTWPELDGPIVDKHSTGGVGDKVSFMLSAIVASCGAYVPMIAGRGLGHTGGTIDKLESINGFNVEPSLKQFKQLVKEHRVAIISQTDSLAPADKRLYGIRDITATVESIPLITASILSKKLAAGLGSLVMDIKVGNGAMMRDLASAELLAQSIVDVANGAGVRTQAIITDMNQVLGSSAGNALEMIETVKYLLAIEQEPRLHEVVTNLASAMLISSGIATEEKQAKQKINFALSSGQAAETFAQMIYAMGGPSDFIDNPWLSMRKAQIVKDVVAPQDGYICGMETRDLGLAIVAMKGGRTANDQQIDHSVGFDHILPIGTLVKRGDVIARIHADNEDQFAQASIQYLSALSFAEDQPIKNTLIYKTIY